MALRLTLDERNATGRTRCMLAVGLAAVGERQPAVDSAAMALDELAAAPRSDDHDECVRRVRRVRVPMAEAAKRAVL